MHNNKLRIIRMNIGKYLIINRWKKKRESHMVNA